MPVKILDNIMVIECATFVGAPVRFDSLARERSQPPAPVGEHSAKVLRELGYREGEVRTLHADGTTHRAN